jgi:hypothetical protein
MNPQADLRDPGVLRDLANAGQAAQSNIGNALDAAVAELARVLEWLRGEQLAHWKRQLARREECFQEAKRAWIAAEGEVRRAPHSRGPAKHSSWDERKAMDKARAARDEADEKLVAVRRWILRLEQEGHPLALACRSHHLALREQSQAVQQRLRSMSEAVHDYLAATLPPTGRS